MFTLFWDWDYGWPAKINRVGRYDFDTGSVTWMQFNAGLWRGFVIGTEEPVSVKDLGTAGLHIGEFGNEVQHITLPQRSLSAVIASAGGYSGFYKGSFVVHDNSMRTPVALGPLLFDVPETLCKLYDRDVIAYKLNFNENTYVCEVEHSSAKLTLLDLDIHPNSIYQSSRSRFVLHGNMYIDFIDSIWIGDTRNISELKPIETDGTLHNLTVSSTKQISDNHIAVFAVNHEYDYVQMHIYDTRNLFAPCNSGPVFSDPLLGDLTTSVIY